MTTTATTLNTRLADSPASPVPFWKHAMELQDAFICDEPQQKYGTGPGLERI